MPIVVRGLNKLYATRTEPDKPSAITLTIHENGVLTIEKSTGDSYFIVSRGPLFRMELMFCHDDENEKDSFEQILFFLSEKYGNTIYCPKGTFNRIKKDVFQL